MIITECVHCDLGFMVPLQEEYLELLKEGRQLLTRHVCEGCGSVNWVEHRRMGGETFGDDDPRANGIEKL